MSLQCNIYLLMLMPVLQCCSAERVLTDGFLFISSREKEQKDGWKMSGGDVVCSGWLRKSPPEKKLRRYVSTREEKGKKKNLSSNQMRLGFWIQTAQMQMAAF